MLLLLFLLLFFQASVNTLAVRNPLRLHTRSHRLFRFVEPSRRKIPLSGSLTNSESNPHFPGPVFYGLTLCDVTGARLLALLNLLF